MVNNKYVRNYFVYFAFAVVLLLNLILNSKLYNYRKTDLKKDNSINFYSELTDEYRFNLNQLYRYEDFKVNNILVKNIDGTELRMKNMIDKNCLIIRYNEFSCLQCIDSLFSCLNNIETINCIIIGKFKTPMQLGSFYRVNQPQYEVYDCYDNLLPIDTLNVPYAIVINKNLEASSFFIPLKEDTRQIKKYLNIIVKKYFH